MVIGYIILFIVLIMCFVRPEAGAGAVTHEKKSSCSRQSAQFIGGQAGFLDGCLQAGRSRASAYRHYVLGLDKNGDKIDLAIHLERGASLYKLTETWLNVWEDPGDSVLL